MGNKKIKENDFKTEAEKASQKLSSASVQSSGLVIKHDKRTGKTYWALNR